jgi:ubiquitin carboxyl-terminal hydrolase 4/11/15
MKEFAREEPLEDDNAWYCPKCKKHQASTKKLDIWTAPDILIFHLKRFSNSGTRWSQSTKVDTMVDFPVQGLDLNRYVLHNDKNPEDLIYDLYAVSNHFGGTGGGHCMYYCVFIMLTMR